MKNVDKLKTEIENMVDDDFVETCKQSVSKMKKREMIYVYLCNSETKNMLMVIMCHHKMSTPWGIRIVKTAINRINADYIVSVLYTKYALSILSETVFGNTCRIWAIVEDNGKFKFENEKKYVDENPVFASLLEKPEGMARA